MCFNIFLNFIYLLTIFLYLFPAYILFFYLFLLDSSLYLFWTCSCNLLYCFHSIFLLVLYHLHGDNGFVLVLAIILCIVCRGVNPLIYWLPIHFWNFVNPPTSQYRNLSLIVSKIHYFNLYKTLLWPSD